MNKKKIKRKNQKDGVNNGWNFILEYKTNSCTNWVWAYALIHVSPNLVEQSVTLHTY